MILNGNVLGHTSCGTVKGAIEVDRPGNQALTLESIIF
jgi:carbonic anhydrase